MFPGLSVHFCRFPETLTPTVELSGGLRYTSEERTGSLDFRNLNNASANFNAQGLSEDFDAVILATGFRLFPTYPSQASWSVLGGGECVVQNSSSAQQSDR